MSSNSTSDFYRCRSDENLHYRGEECETDFLETSFGAMSLLPSASCKALENFARGKNVDSHINQISRLLNGKTSQNFSNLSVVDIQANILLVLCRYSHSQRPEDLSLLSGMLPYYISHLSTNSNELCSGIITKELVECLDNSSSQFLHDLDLCVDKFLKGNHVYRYSKNTECEYLVKIFQRLASDCLSNTHADFATALKAWNEAVSPEPAQYAFVVRRVTEITCSMSTQAKKSPILTFFTYLRRLQISPLFCEEFLKELCVWQVREFAAGVDISNYAGFLESALMGQENLIYAKLTTEQKLANVWLLLQAWKQTQDPRYIDVLQLALPHVACYVHALVPMPSTAQILAGDVQIVESSSTSFSELLMGSNVCFDVESSAQALACYTKNTNPSVKEIKSAVELFGTVLSQRHAVWKLLKRYAQKENDNVNVAASVLHALCCNPNVTTFYEWAANLQDGPVKNLLVQLVNSPHFSKQTRKDLFKNLLFHNSPSTSLDLALMLLPSITTIHIPNLLNSLNTSESIDLFTRQVALVPDEVRNNLYSALENRPALLSKFERALRTDALHPGIDFLLGYIDSEYATEKQRNELLTVFCHRRAPSHYLGLAPRMLRPSNEGEIIEITDKLVERMKADPDGHTMVALFSGINCGKVDWTVRNTICQHLLNKNTAESILLLSQISVHLPLSALWILLKRIDTLKPQDKAAHECRRLALRNLLFATWYADYSLGRTQEQRQITLTQILAAKEANTVFRPASTWYQSRTIILYNQADSYASRIPDRILYLMRKCGLTGKKLQAMASQKIAQLICYQNAARMQGKNKMPSQYPRFIKYIAMTAHRKRQEAASKYAAMMLENSINEAEIPEAVGEGEVIERPMSTGPDSQD